MFACYAQPMRDAANEAARRRRQWAGGVVHADRSAALDAAFWRTAGVAAKLDALRTMVEEFASRNGDGTPARLQRHLGGIRRARG
jgi:hypothetical protein